MDDDVSWQPEGSSTQEEIEPPLAIEIPVEVLAEPKLENGTPLEHVNGQPERDEAKSGTTTPPLRAAATNLQMKDGIELQQQSVEPNALQHGDCAGLQKC